MKKQTRLTGTKPLKNRECPNCGKQFNTLTLAIPGDKKNYCSINCIIAAKL